ncbi:MAG: asparagine synthase (glutamine-hydrolyzing), partial [Deltaproteobacteria bacterium]
LSEKGHQPMSDESGAYLIVYNGEVYNFAEVRTELAALGYVFRSNSDTEVVLYAYMAWGRECVRKFRGMWAFAIWDRNKKELVLCRDRVGVKPLYWYHHNGLFIFSSELKALHQHPGFSKELDQESLALYLQYGYITSPYSIFSHTHKLLPGHFLKIDARQRVEEYSYWDYDSCIDQGLRESKPVRVEDAAQELESILLDSFKLRLVSDVPVGIFLSGGVDSTLVTAMLQKVAYMPLKTFTIGFHEKEYDEAQWARRIADYLGTQHTELYCTPQNAFEVVRKLNEIYDEPFGDPSAIPTYLVSKLAREQVKVSLSADGGDELFFGYRKYTDFSTIVGLVNNPVFKAAALPLMRSLGPDRLFGLYRMMRFALPSVPYLRDSFDKLLAVAGAGDRQSQYETANRFFLKKDLPALGVKGQRDHLAKLKVRNELDLFIWAMAADIKTYLPDDILVKTDRATMAVSLEGREPLLDNRILEFSARLPVSLKYMKGTTKFILKKILHKYVPRELVERPKQGFGVPVEKWFRKDLTALYDEYLGHERIRKEGLFDPEEVSRLVREYRRKPSGVNHQKLWFLFMFQLWKERWL